MRDLSKVADCDAAIIDELTRARIPTVLTLEAARGGVPYSVIGKLDEVTFRRGVVHWLSSGPVPVTVARALYADPVGRTDLLVGGHLGGPSPEDWTTRQGETWFVNSYRIESEVGLRLLADAIRSDVNRVVRVEARLRELEAALKPFGAAYRSDMDRLAAAGAIVPLGTRGEGRDVPLAAFKRARDLTHQPPPEPQAEPQESKP